MQSSCDTMQSEESTSADIFAISAPLRTQFRRLIIKAQIIAAPRAFPESRPLPDTFTVTTSEIGDTDSTELRIARIEKSIQQLESKIDILLTIKANAPEMPSWYAHSEKRILASIADAVSEYDQLALSSRKAQADTAILKKELSELALGADKFLAGLQDKLTPDERDLFFDLITTIADGSSRRLRPYAEIGRKRNVSKQAIQKAYKTLARKHPSVGNYIASIRSPETPRLFSEMSPSERRKYGVDSSYNHKTG